MINQPQLRSLVLQPVMKGLGLYNLAAEHLMVGTALVESRGGTYLKQLGTGPAMGIFQMEPNTHDDIWANFLKYKPQLAAAVKAWNIPQVGDVTELAGNLYYAAAMCRVHYYRVKAPLPAADDFEGMAQYHKRYYNTVEGATDLSESIPLFRQAVTGK